MYLNGPLLVFDFAESDTESIHSEEEQAKEEVSGCQQGSHQLRGLCPLSCNTGTSATHNHGKGSQGFCTELQNG